MSLSTQFLRDTYAVELQTGRLINRKTGRRVGAMDERGRIRFYVGSRQYAMKRVVWQLLTGEAPQGKVVATDGTASNIAWDNLCLHLENGCVIRARDATISPDATLYADGVYSSGQATEEISNHG